MTKITTIDKATLIALRPQIDEALKALGEQLGLSFHAGSGSYGDNTGHFKLEIKVDDPAIQEAAARVEFNQYCSLFKLEPGDFGREVTVNRKLYKVAGLAMGRTKYPIKMTEVATGKTLLFGEAVAANIILARTPVAA